MNYLVIVRYLPFSKNKWQTIQREFDDETSAVSYAEEMYEMHARERCVMIYHLEKSYN